MRILPTGFPTLSPLIRREVKRKVESVGYRQQTINDAIPDSTDLGTYASVEDDLDPDDFCPGAHMPTDGTGIRDYSRKDEASNFDEETIAEMKRKRVC